METKIKHIIVDLEEMTNPLAYDSEEYKQIKLIIKMLNDLIPNLRE